MTRVLTFFVDGRPVPKARARTVRSPYGKPHTFTPKRTAQWENLIRLIAQSACMAAGWKPEKGHYSVDVAVYRARRAGDADNYLKACKDALNAIVWPDDSMVTKATVELFDGQGEGMRVRVTREAA